MKDSSPGGANTPFVYLTRPGCGEHRARILTLGAADAIERPFHVPELAARLRLHLKVKRLQDELVLKNETLARLSTVDGLTGLRARRYLDEVLNIVVLRADERAFGLVVDAVHDTEEIVVKPLGKELKTVEGFAGATILGDGRVALRCGYETKAPAKKP